MPEFLVSRIEPDGLIVGHCGNVSFPVGQVFTSIEKERVDARPPELQVVPLGVVACVTLIVREVLHCRAQVQIAPRGHAVGLRLEGESIHELIRALHERKEHEYIYLRSHASA
jgi:hypothetical protein